MLADENTTNSQIDQMVDQLSNMSEHELASFYEYIERNEQDFTEDKLMDTFFKFKFQMTYMDGDVRKVFREEDGVLHIVDMFDDTEYVKEAKRLRDNFKVSRNTQDHYAQVLVIPPSIHKMFQRECVVKGLPVNGQEFTNYMIKETKVRYPQYLAIPPNYIR